LEDLELAICHSLLPPVTNNVMMTNNNMVTNKTMNYDTV